MKFIPGVILIAIGKAARYSLLAAIRFGFLRRTYEKRFCGTFSLIAIAGCSYNVPSSTPFFSSLPEGVTLEEVKPSKDKVVIPYAKYQLENGLTVILSPDDSDPLVHVDVTYHVGSAREQIGKSGFAHFFEHMMFQGSENCR